MLARLYGKKTSGGKVEILIERILEEKYALAHIRTNKKVKAGTKIEIGEYLIVPISKEQDLYKIFLEKGENFYSLMKKNGSLPLPPYIDRPADNKDLNRYQTVYAKNIGAVAAPTAGLHFSEAMIEKIKNLGVETAEITLHVGAGTFQPLRDENIKEQVLHSEWLEVSESVCKQVQEAKDRAGRVIAVGTTTVRSLETASRSGTIKPFIGDTQLFIQPGFVFNTVDCMVTNFHLPKSSLLMLVAAFSGYDCIISAYQHAINKKYRFFSYGDAMWLAKNN